MASLGGASVASQATGITAAAGPRSDTVRFDRTPKPGRDVFVDPDDGNDDWSGAQATPGGDDGPLASISAAIDAAWDRAQQEATEQLTIWLRGGRYTPTETIQIPPNNSGVEIAIARYPEENPVVSGGREITGWEETQVNGFSAWKADLPSVADGDWYFRQLFVNGERRSRPIVPEEGFYEWVGIPDSAEAGYREQHDTFRYEEGQVDPDWRNIQDIDAVIFQIWLDNRTPLESINPEQGTVTTQLHSDKGWNPNQWYSPQKFYLENVFEALTDPGEWYLDRQEGTIYYIPMDGESMDSITAIAPVLTTLFRFDGGWSDGDFVRDITLHGLTFRHGGYVIPGLNPDILDPEDNQLLSTDGKSASQSYPYVPGLIELHAARNCSVEECRFQHCGFYGIDVDFGSQNNRFIGNHLSDLGAGGIKQSGGRIKSVQKKYIDETEPEASRTRGNVISDNHIYDMGHVFQSGTGILSRHSADNTITHNEIHDGHYHGISVGWTWLYQPSVEQNNHIEHNHVYNLGRRFRGEYLLNDKGGIYTLAQQPGTAIRHNLISNISGTDISRGIYLDQSSSHMTIENNLVYDTLGASMHIHYGADNTIRNNIFAMPGSNVFGLSNGKLPQQSEYTDVTAESSATLKQNVMVADDASMVRGGYNWAIDQSGLKSDRNLLWNYGDEGVYFGQNFDPANRVHGPVSLKYKEEGSSQPTSLVTNLDSTGRQRNNYDGFNGMQITVGRSPLEVTHLGLYKIQGSNGQHRVKLVNPKTGQDIADGDVEVDLSSGGAGEFVYASLSIPVTLEANTTYYLVAEQRSGGDMWYNAGETVVATRGDESVDGPVYYASGQNEWVSRASQRMNITEWREMGRGADSVVAEPLFTDLQVGDYSFREDSPISEIDFREFDLDTIGIRGASDSRQSTPPETRKTTPIPRSATETSTVTDVSLDSDSPPTTTVGAPLGLGSVICSLLGISAYYAFLAPSGTDEE
jgi:parallel beta-helix repeat protein